jgi:hypothetical protein
MDKYKSAIDSFVEEVSKITADEPLDGDETQEIANKVHEELDMYFGNTPQNVSAKKYASTSWCVEDVFEEADNRGIEISRENAETLLAENSDKIVEAMIENGWHIISELLSGYKNKKKE